MKIKKIVLTATTVLTLSVCSLQPTITASASNSNITVEQNSNSIEPRSDYKTWMYKVENGKVYKRLYNCSTGVWIGDWIYVGEYTGD